MFPAAEYLMAHAILAMIGGYDNVISDQFM
jgi:hypothetical protein